MKPPTYLFSGSYEYCTACKSGKFVPESTGTQDEAQINFGMKVWREFHFPHAGHTQTTTPQHFLSVLLSEGYVDEDREDLEPITTEFGKTGENTSGLPVGRDAALSVQKKMRWEDRPPVAPLIPEKAHEVGYQRAKSGFQVYHDALKKNWNLVDVGINFSRIVLCLGSSREVESKTLTEIKFIESQAIYRLVVDKETLDYFFSEGKDTAIENAANCDMIRIAAMVRFGDDVPAQIEWLAQTIIGLREQVEKNKKS